MSVYFILAEDGNAIKIGHCKLPAQRAASMQSQHWSRLWLIGAMRGARPEELRMHKKFAHLKILGEWFRSDNEILAFIDRLPLRDMAEMFDGCTYGTKYIQPSPRTEKARIIAYKLWPRRRWNGKTFEFV